MRMLSVAAKNPYPAQEINFTVQDKLILFGYAYLKAMPSPYKTHKPGKMVDYIFVTGKGLEALSNMVTKE